MLMRRAFRLLLLLPLRRLAGCGGGGGSTAPSASVSVVDGVTGAAPAGTSVAGRPGDSVTIERAGYLRRDTVVPRDGVVSLWPITVDEAFVRTLVYSESALRNRLVRWPGTTITVPRDFPSDVADAVRPWLTLLPSDTPPLPPLFHPPNPPS